jgi:two-component system, LytTR family, response regulator
MAIKCLIVDDEPPAREVLKRYVEQLPMLHLTGECSNAIQAIGMLQQQHIDLLFLDIRMPQLNGMDFLKTLSAPPKIIFTTAYAEYAVESYELDIADYLMKPIRFDRFIKSINKAFPKQTSMETTEKLHPADEKSTESFVYFRADRKMVKVLLNDILYIESMKDYVKVCTTHNTIITKQSLSSVEAMLPEKSFIRTHRSFIVSIQHINTFTNEIIEINKMEIPIGRLYRNTVLKVLIATG